MRDLTSRGLGVVNHPAGRVLFAPGTWPGERGRFEITALRGRSGEARLVELLTASPQRGSAPCPYHGFTESHCGGCPWMFMDYAAQLEAKQARVQRATETLGAGAVAPIRPAPATLGYRNRAQPKSDGRRLGFQAAGSHAIVDVQDCIVLDDHNRRTLRALRERLPNPAWRGTRRGDWVTLHIDDAIAADDVVAKERRPFRQGNTQQNEWLRAALRDTVIGLGAPSPVVELFAGSGNFTEVLADAGCTTITAVDSFAPAIDALAASLGAAVTARCLALDQASSLDALRPALAEARLLVLDPPRDGFGLLPACLAASPRLEAVIYVSCDVATWARDCAGARGEGFELVTVRPLDLFPHTPHVEILSLLQRAPTAA